MKKSYWILLGLAAAVLLYLYLSSRSKQSEEEKLQRNARVVKVGDHVPITLLEQSGTGYVWEVEPFDSQAIELVSENVVKTTSQEQLVGAPAVAGAENVRVFEFRPLRLGFITLRFQYRRPWEQEVAALERRTVELSVQ